MHEKRDTILIADDEPVRIDGYISAIRNRFGEKAIVVKMTLNTSRNYLASYGDKVFFIVLDLMFDSNGDFNADSGRNAGINFYDEIRKLDILKEVPIFILTNRSRAGLKDISFVKDVSANNDEFYEKDLYKPDELVSNIEKKLYSNNQITK